MENLRTKLLTKLTGLGDNLNQKDLEVIIAQFFKDETASDKPKVWKSRWGRIVFIGSIVLAIFTILKMTNCFNLQHPDTPTPFDLIAYFAWTILPPSWFLLEYVWLFPDKDKLNSDKVADLKYAHELAGKIWAALVVLISVLLYLKYGHLLGESPATAPSSQH
jgi:hypothetical protein